MQKTSKNSAKSEPKVRCSRLVRLQGVRVKLNNRRVYAALGPDQRVWLKFVRLEKRKQKATSIKLSQDAAAATVSAILAILDEAMRTGTGKQPNDQAHPTAAEREVERKETKRI